MDVDWLDRISLPDAIFQMVAPTLWLSANQNTIDPRIVYHYTLRLALHLHLLSSLTNLLFHPIHDFLYNKLHFDHVDSNDLNWHPKRAENGTSTDLPIMYTCCCDQGRIVILILL
jgi:hypothetical protein